MFKKIDDYEIMSVNYDKRVFVLVAKKKVESVSFNYEFLVIGECLNIEGEIETLSYSAIKELRKTDLEKLFYKQIQIFNSGGITFFFTPENKEFVMSFFNTIPFFI